MNRIVKILLMKKFFLKVFILLLFLSLSFLSVFASLGDSYCVELGKAYLEKGDIYQAEIEFRKALMVNPANQEAQKYLTVIRRKKIEKTLDIYSGSKKLTSKKEKIIYRKPSSRVLAKSTSSSVLSSKRKKTHSAANNWQIKGEYQTSFGITSDDFLWKRANWDLNEEDWRILSSNAYDRRANTYDPAIFTQVKFNLDYPEEEGWGFHSTIDISPWSFIGKSNKVTISGVGTTDTADIELKYWAATGYTINETVYTLRDGAAIILPELKVKDGKVESTHLESTWTSSWPAAYFVLPELKIHREFWPLRELWFTYTKNDFSFTVFPVALEDRAYSSDDPLGLSNHRVYWEESPWLDDWHPGHFNSGAGALDFSKGFWDDSLSWFTRDSQGTRLTNLRGFSFSWKNMLTEFDCTFASPKNLWQDYDEFNVYVGALRAKHFLADNFRIGSIYTLKLGYSKGKRDATNQVIGLDFIYGLDDYSKVSFEIAKSSSVYDRTSSYKTDKRGNAIKFSFIRSSCSDIFDKDYFEIKPKEATQPYYKFRLELTHMDKGFEAGLSDYRETRDDMFWSRHIHFGEPFRYHYVGLSEPSITWDDIKPFRIGDGIDYGRDVFGFRLEGENFLDGRYDWLFDVRNVHATNGKYIETVSRIESTYRVNTKLTTKFLGIYHDKPDTVKGVDPFIFDIDTGEYYLNDAIEDGKDPSLKTISLGAQYKLNDRCSIYGIWERTNDSTLAYDNFPRSILRDSSFADYVEEDREYRKEVPFLYSQANFPQPPYPYYNIFKVGLDWSPNNKVKIGLDWTHNDYRYAGQIDSNINHIGFNFEYKPWEKCIFYFQYVYSKWNDINRLISGESDLYQGHHNFFAEFRYQPTSVDEFLFQYGVTTRGIAHELIYDPYGGSLAVLDTQHIFRIYYRKKF